MTHCCEGFAHAISQSAIKSCVVYLCVATDSWSSGLADRAESNIGLNAIKRMKDSSRIVVEVDALHAC